jgi:hypothetical protein
VLRSLLSRFRKRGDERAIERAIAEGTMSPHERRLAEESVDSLQSDNLAELESQTGTFAEHLEDDDVPRSRD